MPPSRYYSSVAQQTSLTASIAPSTTSIAVASTVGFPSTTPYTLALDFGQANEELVEVTGVAGLNLTVTRSIDGTSASDHAAGAVVRHVSSGRDFADSRLHESKSDEVHGLTGAANNVVGTTQTQTLLNKTLDSPVLTTPVIASFANATHDHSSAIQGGNPLRSIDVQSTATNVPSLKITGIASQSADLIVAQDSALAEVLAVDRFGTIDITHRNNAVTAFTLNAASGMAGDLLSLQVNSTERFVIDSSGQIDVGPTWTSYTPTWTVETGTNPSIGNGTLAGQYCRVGKLVFVKFSMTAGSTTTFGTAGVNNNWLFSLPSGRAADSSLPLFFGSGFGTHNGVTTRNLPFMAEPYVAGGSTAVRLYITGGFVDGVAATNGGYVDALSPATWTTASFLSFEGVYRLA